MAKIERGQFSTFLRRYLGMSGESFVSDELAPEVSPILVLESERAEWEFLKNAKLLAFQNNFSPAAASAASWRIRNPVTSGIVAVFEDIVLSANVDTFVQIGISPTDQPNFANLGAVAARDTRIRLETGSALVTSFESAGGITGNIITGNFISAFNPWRYKGRTIVLTPGGIVGISTAALTGTAAITAWWLEKPLPDLERS